MGDAQARAQAALAAIGAADDIDDISYRAAELARSLMETAIAARGSPVRR